MNKTITKIAVALPLLTVAQSLSAQAPVTVGRASYGATLPTYKAWSAEHNGVNATYSMTRRYYVDETDAEGNPRPIPTNDWWTDVINNRFSEGGGALWSYPAMVRANPDGFQISYPTYWQKDGGEMRASTWVKVGGTDFTPVESRAADWHDWDVEVKLPSRDNRRWLKGTLVHGQPFTWVEFQDVKPFITFSATPNIIKETEGAMLLSIDGTEDHNVDNTRVRTDYYAIYFDARTSIVTEDDGSLKLSGTRWVTVAMLPDAASFERYSTYATSIVRDTRVSWSYNDATSLLETKWNVTAENLRYPSAPAPVMQGFLPHAYKHAVNPSALINTADTYLTPRGLMKMATSANGEFGYAYRFYGMLPYYAKPVAGNIASEADFNPETARQLISAYAEKGTFGADTYWGGKGLTQMALNMTFAKELGHDDLYEMSKKKLRDALTDWLTYTPGEENRFFAYYPRMGGMLGFDVSYDSDSFNDHHFHYGYFMYAAALLCFEDADFARDYGELLTMIAKDYANYDRNDNRFPFLRTLDPWAGHSYAGGMGDHGNDNGNGQESSSEAMQGWGGIYLLGVALGDKNLRDAGIFGWMTESRGTAEYWFDRDHIKYNSAASFDPAKSNYDYTKYPHPWNTNLTSKGIGWWTWFSGDPVWMHSIQWMPISPCLNYLSEDVDFARWDYDTMKSKTQSDWWVRNQTGEDGNGNPLYADVWGDASLGNVVLAYMQRGYPSEAAEIFYKALTTTNPYRGDGQWGMAYGIDTGHISYYTIHNHLTYGEIDTSVTASIPTANCFVKNGHKTYQVYNPGDEELTVTFSDGRTVKAPAHRLTAFDAQATATSLRIDFPAETGAYVEPGKSAQLSVVCLDQYGATIAAPAAYEWSVTQGATVTQQGRLSVNSNTARGSKMTVTVKAGALTTTAGVTADAAPKASTATITGLPAIIEAGADITLGLSVTDQYAKPFTPASVSWTFTSPEGKSVTTADGRNNFSQAGIWTVSAATGSVQASATVKVMPRLPNVALHKEATASSYENEGSKPVGATDGDYGKRWGSQHSDNQWLMVDLGETYMLTGASILWETAYGADYDIELSIDGRTWTTGAEVRGNSGAGWRDTPLDGSARYVRINCIRRGSTYGFSFYELEVRGISADTDSNAVVGIEATAENPYLRDDESTALSATAVTFGGSRRKLADSEVNWSSDKGGTFKNATFSPATYGLHTLTAASGASSSTTTLLVEETEKLYSLECQPAEITMLEQSTAIIDVVGYNQFKHNNEWNNNRGLFAIDPDKLEVIVLGPNKIPVTDPAVARYDLDSQTFHGNLPGEYTLVFSYDDKTATAKVNVQAFASFNLATGKPARASSDTKGAASNATDGLMNTRWESDWSEPQTITVDLLDVYELTSIKVCWEGAYATDYEVQIADDPTISRAGEQWTTVENVTDWNGQPSLNREHTVKPDNQARYIRIVCNKRALPAYGFSIFEIEAYGSRKVSLIDNVVTHEPETVDVYTISGLPVMRGAERAGLASKLAPGIYIVNCGTYSRKIVIR